MSHGFSAEIEALARLTESTKSLATHVCALFSAAHSNQRDIAAISAAALFGSGGTGGLFVEIADAYPPLADLVAGEYRTFAPNLPAPFTLLPSSSEHCHAVEFTAALCIAVRAALGPPPWLVTTWPEQLVSRWPDVQPFLVALGEQFTPGTELIWPQRIENESMAARRGLRTVTTGPVQRPAGKAIDDDRAKADRMADLWNRSGARRAWGSLSVFAEEFYRAHGYPSAKACEEAVRGAIDRLRHPPRPKDPDGK